MIIVCKCFVWLLCVNLVCDWGVSMLGDYCVLNAVWLLFEYICVNIVCDCCVRLLCVNCVCY